MIVSSDLLSHPKYLVLEKTIGPKALHYLYRLWAHCASEMRGQVWAHADASYVEAVCQYSGRPSGKLFAALTRGLTPTSAGFIEVMADRLVIHDWDSVNASLIKNWKNGAKGGRPITLGLPQDNPTKTPGTPDKIRGEEIRVEERRVDGSAPLYPPPSFNQVMAYAKRLGWSYTAEEIKRTYLAFEGAKTVDGSWRWGNHPVTHWPASFERRILDDKNRAATANPVALNGRIREIKSRLENIEHGYAIAVDPTETYRLGEELKGLQESQKQATGQ